MSMSFSKMTMILSRTRWLSVWVLMACTPPAPPMSPASPVSPVSPAPSTPSTATATPAPSSSVALITAGDIAQCDQAAPADSAAARTAALTQGLLAQDAKAQVLTLGDNTYPDGKPAEFAQCYAPTWGAFLDRTWGIPGNHDYRTQEASGYYDYFGKAAGPERRGYYAQSLNGWTILALNSNLGGKAMDAQLAFVKQALADNTQGCVLAAWHHPVYTSSIRVPELTMRPVWRLLQDAKADVILVGHEHYYEQLSRLNYLGDMDEQTGIESFVVGTGGAKLYVAGAKHLASVKQIVQQYGVMRWQLMPGHAHWEFINTQNEALTQGRISCKAKRDERSKL
jgi:acid phosphatase type 7